MPAFALLLSVLVAGLVLILVLVLILILVAVAVLILVVHVYPLLVAYRPKIVFTDDGGLFSFLVWNETALRQESRAQRLRLCLLQRFPVRL